MIVKIWKKEQIEDLKDKLNGLVKTTNFCNEECVNKITQIVNEYINILNDNYGEKRNPDTSLGGWIAVILNSSLENIQAEYKDFLNSYSLERELAEVNECVVECENGIQWVLEIYIVSSDYGYVLLFPEKNEQNGGF